MAGLDIKLHAGQLKIYQDKHKIRTAVMGRRFGKSKLMTYELLLASLGFPGKTDLTSPEKVLCALPTLVQAKKVIWQPLVNLATQTELSKYVRNVNKSEYRITFEGRKPDIVVTGANESSGDGLRGSRFWFVGLDEYQDMKPGIFDAVIAPAMADTKGSRALITGTPKGRTNVLYEMYERAEKFPDTYASFNMPTSCNPTIDREEIARAKLTLPPKLFRQEFESSFESNEFAIYTELDEQENRCDRLPDNFDKVVMGIDWGDTHPAIVVWGELDNYWYYIDGWSPDGSAVIPQPLFDAKLVELASRWQPVGSFADPSRPASILNVRTLGKQHGLIGLKRCVEGFNKIADGNNQVHSLIFQRRILIPREDITKGRRHHITGDVLYNQMANYHYEVTKDGVVTEKVAPSQIDHTIDATRYLFARKQGTI